MYIYTYILGASDSHRLLSFIYIMYFNVVSANFHERLSCISLSCDSGFCLSWACISLRTATSPTMVLGSISNKRKSAPRGMAAHKHLRPSGVVLAHQMAFRSGHVSNDFSSNGSSTSTSVGHRFSTNSVGRRSLRQEYLHASAIQVRQNNDHVEYQQHQDSMSIDEHSQLAVIRADEYQDFSEQAADSEMDIHDILAGDTAAEISHAGSEFAELLAIEDGLLGPASR
jgi:hypothetical protein